MWDYSWSYEATDTIVVVDWPLVDPKDDGIRPLGRPDECFYCNQKIGTPHKQNCCIVKKLVELAVTFEGGAEHRGLWRTLVPYKWGSSQIEFHQNESSWCASNFLDERDAGTVTWEGPEPWDKLEEADKERCLCGILSFKFIRVVDATPVRKLCT